MSILTALDLIEIMSLYLALHQKLLSSIVLEPSVYKHLQVQVQKMRMSRMLPLLSVYAMFSGKLHIGLFLLQISTLAS